MESHLYPVPSAAAERALVTAQQYEAMYARSVEDNEGFWSEQAQRVDWIKPFSVNWIALALSITAFIRAKP